MCTLRSLHVHLYQLLLLFISFAFSTIKNDSPSLLRGCLVMYGGTDRGVVGELGVIPIHYLKAGGLRSAIIGCNSRVPAMLTFSLVKTAVICNIYFKDYFNYQIYKMEHFL